MTDEVQREELKTHQTTIGVARPSASEVDAGTHMRVEVQVSCAETCDLRGSVVRLADRDGTIVQEIELATFDEGVNKTGEFEVKVPLELGEYTWTALFPAGATEGILHAGSSAPLSFIVKPHSTSTAVWDVPSPVPFGEQFEIKVGVKCSAGCQLGDKEIEVFDDDGKKVASGLLGGAPWPHTRALYWRQVELNAPEVQGHYAWSVEFAKPDLEPPHEGASCSFSFTTGAATEHLVAVQVIEQDSNAPVERAHVILRPRDGYPYRGFTDDSGVAKLEVPKGEYELHVVMRAYEDFQRTVEVAEDATIKAELVLRPVDTADYFGLGPITP